MFKLALVALLCAQAFARPQEVEIDPHIVGGTTAQEGDYPFVASLRLTPSFTFCGGALLSDRYVVTAAHCVVPKKPLKVGVGSVHLSKQKLYEVDQVIVHPGYESVNNTNDIALLRLTTPVELGENVQTIKFPVTEDLEGKTLTGMGWGRTAANEPVTGTLMYLNRPVISNQECTERLNNFPIFDSQICLQGEENFGMCFGDSGSPLLYKGDDGQNYIAGLASWAIPCAKGYPDVFTRISNYNEWLNENMA